MTYKMLVIGDSHSWVFKYLNKKQDKYQFTNIIIDGATCLGLKNPNSKTNARKKINDVLFNENLKKYDKIMFMLGEVDVGYLIWYLAKIRNISIKSLFKRSIKNFLELILSIKNYPIKNIVIVGCTLPTVKKMHENKSDLTNNRTKINVDIKKRTKFTLKYNRCLDNLSKKYGFQYIDITKYTIDKDTGTINQFYIYHKDDHHLSVKKTYTLWLKELNLLFK